MALDVDMTPTMGMNALLMGVAAVIIGSIDSLPGIALGALLLGGDGTEPNNTSPLLDLQVDKYYLPY